MDEIKVRRFFNAHIHFRFGALLRMVVAFTASICTGAVVMPNRKKTRPILNGADVKMHRKEILSATAKRFPWFDPFMVVQITPTTTLKDLKSAWLAGARAAKIFPKSVSNSEFGVEFYSKLRKLLEFMEEVGMHLLLHGEHPGVLIDTMDAERYFMQILKWIVRNFPKLKITLEHVSTEIGIDTANELWPNVAYTVTCQHATKSMNDLIKQKVRVHNFCMPVLKYRSDMLAVRRAMVSNHPGCMYGGDSAPHRWRTKECAEGCAGVFNATVEYETVAEVFEEEGASWKTYEDLTSTRALNRYGLPVTSEQVTLVRKDWTVPPIYQGTLVPFRAMETIRFEIPEAGH
jgi:dihydroorotase